MFEVDDTAEQADVLEIDQPRRHSLHNVGDEDWTSFTLSSPSSISLVTIVADNIVDTSSLEMTLFDEVGNQVATDLDQISDAEAASPLRKSIDIQRLGVGTYRLRVRAISPSILVDNYSLEFTGPQEDSICFPIVVSNGGDVKLHSFA